MKNPQSLASIGQTEDYTAWMIDPREKREEERELVELYSEEFEVLGMSQQSQ